MKETVVLTKELIEQGMSCHRGCNKAQLALLGVPWPPRKGWKLDMEGKEISQEDYQLYLKLEKTTGKYSLTKWISQIINDESITDQQFRQLLKARLQDLGLETTSSVPALF